MFVLKKKKRKNMHKHLKMETILQDLITYMLENPPLWMNYNDSTRMRRFKIQVLQKQNMWAQKVKLL